MPSFYSIAFIICALSKMSFAQVFLKEIQKSMVTGRTESGISRQRNVGGTGVDRGRRMPFGHPRLFKK